MSSARAKPAGAPAGGARFRRTAGVLALLLSLPLQAPGQGMVIPVPNADFEQGSAGWEIAAPAGGCMVTDKQAAHGAHSLQILSAATGTVRVCSGLIPCRGPRLLELHGRFLARWGYYLTLKVEPFNAAGEPLPGAPPFTLGPFGLNNVWEELIGYRGAGPFWISDPATHVRIVLEGKPGQDRPIEVYFDNLQLLDLGATPSNQPPVNVATQLLQVVGRHTRIVWTRGSRDSGGVLMGFDSQEGRERVLLDRPDCEDPRLTPDGTRIVFSRRADQTAHIIGWDGSGLRALFAGRSCHAVGVAVDSMNGVEWVYVSDSCSKEAVAEIKERGLQASDDSGLAMYRHRMDDLSVKELVWDKAPFNRRTYVTADGASLYGEFPWPNCGVATLPNGAWTLYGHGCNPALAPDGSGRFFLLLGNHRQLRLFPPGGPAAGGGVLFHVNTMAGNLKDPQRAVWRPRWSNDVRFFTINSCDLGPGSDIYLGAFNADFSGVQQWVRITDSDAYDADASAWVAPRPASTRPDPR